MVKNINYKNYKQVNKYLKTVFLALNDEGYIGVYNKQFRDQIGIIPFSDTYNLEDLEKS